MKKLNSLILLVVFVVIGCLISNRASTQIRTRTLRTDEILNVNLAMGIATIIEIPESIQTMIIGDQSAFKVEYLDRAVTIKPLRPLAKTNLYLLTGQHRFDVRLTTVSQDRADYVVYVKNAEAKSTVKWREIKISTENKHIQFMILRVGRSSEGGLLFEGKLTLLKDQSQVDIAPADFWVFQGSKSKIINSLFLSQTKISRELPVALGLSISKSEIDITQPITVELRAGQKLSLIIPGGVQWK
jgi:hypothetical protein